jgi:SAM-dependent methyltransferase
MKKVKDNFSVQSKGYKKFRPEYPSSLLEEILRHVEKRDSCWDCATGNGQIAIEMANHFQTIVASDISQEQLENAPVTDNLEYVKCRAEKTPFADDSFDLITVGQAAHWFDFDPFNKEVNRVLKNNGIVAIIGYGLMYGDRSFNDKLLQFYDGEIGAYWDVERKHIDAHYSSIPFPFDPIELSTKYSIDVQWSLAQLEGYLNTWSSVNRYIQKNGENPIPAFVGDLSSSGVWNGFELKNLHFPLFVKLGRVIK